MPHQRDQRTHHNRDTQRAQQLQTGQHEWAGNQARRDGRVQKPATNYAKKPKAPKVVDTMDKGIQTDPINPLDFVGKDKIAAPPPASNTSMTNTTTLITKTTTTTNTPKMRKKKLGAKTKRKMNRKKLKPKPSSSTAATLPISNRVPSGREMFPGPVAGIASAAVRSKQLVTAPVPPPPTIGANNVSRSQREKEREKEREKDKRKKEKARKKQEMHTQRIAKLKKKFLEESTNIAIMIRKMNAGRPNKKRN